MGKRGRQAKRLGSIEWRACRCEGVEAMAKEAKRICCNCFIEEGEAASSLVRCHGCKPSHLKGHTVYIDVCSS